MPGLVGGAALPKIMAKSGGEPDLALHLIKLAAGAESLASLQDWQAARLARDGRVWHRTRMMPRRRDELLDGGSIYWVIKGLVQARQRILEIERVIDGNGRPDTILELESDLVRTEPGPCRAFQGWRYLTPEKAPKDLNSNGFGQNDMPPEMIAELRELGLL